MSPVKITQVRSAIGGTHVQRATLQSLGLKKIGATVVRERSAEVNGMIDRVKHLVSTEEVK